MNKKEQIAEILSRGIVEIIDKENLEKKIAQGKSLRIKHGVDPTTPDLHLGHAVIYRKLREFQKLGHKIIFLIGDFTARFGDPTEKKAMRKMREKSEIKKLEKNYLQQVGKFLDLKKTEIRHNSEWYEQMSCEELLRLLSRFTVQRMLERDMFQERIKKKKEIGLHEPAYPVLQGYDSVMLKSDVTIIGSDQKFNELQGRKLQQIFGQAPQDIIIMELLIGTDGKKKMSQSLGNYIGIEEAPSEQYGKIMSIPDQLIIHYFNLLTDLPLDITKKYAQDLKRSKINPRDLKMQLAKKIVQDIWGRKKAKTVEEEFVRIFQRKLQPQRIPQTKIAYKEYEICDLLVKLGLTVSKSEARRLIQQKGVRVEGKIVFSPQEKIKVKKKLILQIGRRKFIQIA